MEPLLLQHEWNAIHGEKFITAAMRPGKKSCGAVNVDRCLAIANGKNRKIRARNEAGYSAYVAQWEANGGDLSKVDPDPEVFQTVVSWVSRERGIEAARILVRLTGRYVETDGKFRLA